MNDVLVLFFTGFGYGFGMALQIILVLGMFAFIVWLTATVLKRPDRSS